MAQDDQEHRQNDQSTARDEGKYASLLVHERLWTRFGNKNHLRILPLFYACGPFSTNVLAFGGFDTVLEERTARATRPL